MQRKPWSKTVCMVAGLVALLVACSTDTSSTGASAGSPKPRAPKPGSTTSGAPGTVAAAISPNGGDGGCNSRQSGNACTACCENAHPAGAKAYDDLYYDCLCDAARCATECAKTECGDDDNSPDPTPGDACDLCLKKYSNDDGTGACDLAPRPKCESDVECRAFLVCDDACE